MLPRVHRRAARRHRQSASTARSSPPPQVVRYDGDDPYLVVAADQGTATFSDIANEIAVARGFWLGDAFASGGSTGYDHKKMGITARGAWESVKRHFRQLGIDVQHDRLHRRRASATCRATSSATACCSRSTSSSSPRSTTGTSSSIPNPDAAASFAERARLFALPAIVVGRLRPRRSSRAGGGVYPRTAKAIAGHARGAGRGSASPTVSSVLTPERADDPAHPARARRPAVERRHRHLS